MRIGVIGAMDIEIAMLREKIAPETKKITSIGGLTFFSGQIEGVDTVVVKSGVGKVNAALCAARLISQFAVDYIINTGIAGGLKEGLKVFDMVISRDAQYFDMDATIFGYKECEIPQMKTSIFSADDGLIDAGKKAFDDTMKVLKKEPYCNSKLLVGRVASGDQFIADKEKKEHIKKITGAACCEMEGAAIAHTCFLNNTPFVILRCISDMADDSAESAYPFNEEVAAVMSGEVVLRIIGGLNE